MTLDELIALARTIFKRNASVKFGDPRYTCSINSQELRSLLGGILDLLAEDAPCGFDPPRTNGGYVHLPSSWDGSVTPDDARALARLLLSAADEADAKGKP